MKTTVGQGLCLTLSLVLVLGSVLSITDPRKVYAIDMSDAPATKDTTTAGSDEGEGDQGDNNDDQEDDPVIQETITAGGGTEDDDEEENSEQSRDNDNNNDNDDNRNQPATSTGATERPDCPKNQEQGLFDPCIPVQACGNDVAASQPRDLTVTQLDNCNDVMIEDPDSVEK